MSRPRRSSRPRLERRFSLIPWHCWRGLGWRGMGHIMGGITQFRMGGSIMPSLGRRRWRLLVRNLRRSLIGHTPRLSSLTWIWIKKAGLNTRWSIRLKPYFWKEYCRFLTSHWIFKDLEVYTASLFPGPVTLSTWKIWSIWIMTERIKLLMTQKNQRKPMISSLVSLLLE